MHESTRTGARLRRTAAAMAGWVALLLAAAGLAACGTVSRTPVRIEAQGRDVVAAWSEVAAAAIAQPPRPDGTEEERQPIYTVDMATVHVAMHDAVAAIDPRHRALLAARAAPQSDASVDAAVSAAAQAVLQALYPSKGASFRAAYDAALASVPDGPAKQAGAALGEQVGAAVVAARAHDGRSQSLPPFVPGTQPGEYRGPALVGRTFASMRPFVLASASSMRAPGPRALSSAAYRAVPGTVPTAVATREKTTWNPKGLASAAASGWR